MLRPYTALMTLIEQYIMEFFFLYILYSILFLAVNDHHFIFRMDNFFYTITSTWTEAKPGEGSWSLDTSPNFGR